MVRFSSPGRFLVLLFSAGWLTACSMIPGFGDKEELTERRKETRQNWHFVEQWQLEEEPDTITTDTITSIAGDKVTLKGECHLEPAVLGMAAEGQKKGLFIPLLKVDKDVTLSPDLETSARLYKSFTDHWRLASAGESFQFYQRLLSSVEHSCPENATRKVENCSLKKLMTFGGLVGQKSVYDVSRLERWFDSHAAVGYLIMGPAERYNSSALLHSRYSPNSRVLTEASRADREKDVLPSSGQLRLDWVVPESSVPLFKSRGYCRLQWQELEQKRQRKGGNWPGVMERQKVNKALTPYFIEFLDRAWQTLPAGH
ncbi:MAG: hypothetical protein ACR2PT_22310 [Endozoicomonas sp.]